MDMNFQCKEWGAGETRGVTLLGALKSMFLISKALANCCISIKQQIIEVATISGSGSLSKEHSGNWSYIPYFTQAGEEDSDRPPIALRFGRESGGGVGPGRDPHLPGQKSAVRTGMSPGRDPPLSLTIVLTELQAIVVLCS